MAEINQLMVIKKKDSSPVIRLPSFLSIYLISKGMMLLKVSLKVGLKVGLKVSLKVVFKMLLKVVFKVSLTPFPPSLPPPLRPRVSAPC